MTVLRIHRPYQYVTSFAKYTLLVDGVRTAQIRSGETIEVPVSAGTHSLVAKIDWCSSNVLQLTCLDGQVRGLEVGCRVRGWRWPLYPLCITVLYSRFLYLLPSVSA